MSNKKCTGKEWDTCRVEKMGCEGCYYDCVSKNKIRAKIEEYKGLKKIDKSAYEEQIKPLEELLEEGE